MTKLHVCNAWDFLDNPTILHNFHAHRGNEVQGLFDISRFPLILFDSIRETFCDQLPFELHLDAVKKSS